MASGRIQVLNCCGVSSSRNAARQRCQKRGTRSCVDDLAAAARGRDADGRPQARPRIVVRGHRARRQGFYAASPAQTSEPSVPQSTRAAARSYPQATAAARESVDSDAAARFDRQGSITRFNIRLFHPKAADHETHVPTLGRQAQAHARLSRPHEDPSAAARCSRRAAPRAAPASRPDSGSAPLRGLRPVPAHRHRRVRRAASRRGADAKATTCNSSPRRPRTPPGRVGLVIAEEGAAARGRPQSRAPDAARGAATPRARRSLDYDVILRLKRGCRARRVSADVAAEAARLLSALVAEESRAMKTLLLVADPRLPIPVATAAGRELPVRAELFRLRARGHRRRTAPSRARGSRCAASCAVTRIIRAATTRFRPPRRLPHPVLPRGG